MTDFEFTFMEERWLTALESGKYKQVRGEAQKDGGFCALNLWSQVNGYYATEGVNDRPFTKRNRELIVKLNDELGLTFPEIAAEARKTPYAFFNRGWI